LDVAVTSNPSTLVEKRTAFFGVSSPLSLPTGDVTVRVNFGMRNLSDITGCIDRVDEFVDVTVDVDCDAADNPNEVGGAVVGVLVPKLGFLSEEREGDGGNGGTNGIA
jgi:hypothetical protein